MSLAQRLSPGKIDHVLRADAGERHALQPLADFFVVLAGSVDSQNLEELVRSEADRVGDHAGALLEFGYDFLEGEILVLVGRGRQAVIR